MVAEEGTYTLNIVGQQLGPLTLIGPEVPHPMPGDSWTITYNQKSDIIALHSRTESSIVVYDLSQTPTVLSRVDYAGGGRPYFLIRSAISADGSRLVWWRNERGQSVGQCSNDEIWAATIGDNQVLWSQRLPSIARADISFDGHLLGYESFCAFEQWYRIVDLEAPTETPVELFGDQGEFFSGAMLSQDAKVLWAYRFDDEADRFDLYAIDLTSSSLEAAVIWTTTLDNVQSFGTVDGVTAGNRLYFSDQARSPTHYLAVANQPAEEVIPPEEISDLPLRPHQLVHRRDLGAALGIRRDSQTDTLLYWSLPSGPTEEIFTDATIESAQFIDDTDRFLILLDKNSDGFRAVVADRGQPFVSFAQPVLEVSEDDRAVEIEMMLDRGQVATTEIHIMEIGGSATGHIDYRIPNPIATFEPGQLTASFQLEPLVDASTEGHETIILAPSSDFAHPTLNSTLTINLRDAANCGTGRLCLVNDRFEVDVSWHTEEGRGFGVGTPLSDLSASYWFFEPGNVELLLKVLRGCGVNGHYWVAAAGLTDVGVELRVVDVERGEVWTSENESGNLFAPVLDTAAFPCADDDE